MIKLLILVISIVSLQALEVTSNTTCRVQSRSKCFLGKCPQGFTCLKSTDECCQNDELVYPDAGCTDFLEGCESINCEHRDFYEFARANCARTCNFCDLKPLSPEYNCNDILDDCKDRANLCRDRDFYSSMALYCPRTCALCNYSEFDINTCEDGFNDCEKRGQAFCDNHLTSLFQLSHGCGNFCKFCK